MKTKSGLKKTNRAALKTRPASKAKPAHKKRLPSKPKRTPKPAAKKKSKGEAPFASLFTRPPERWLKYTTRKEIGQHLTAPPAKQVEHRPLKKWTGNRDEWEVSFLLSEIGLAKVASDLIFPKIADIAQVVPIVILGQQFLFQCEFQFERLLISIDKAKPSSLNIQLRIKSGQISAPGYKIDFAGETIVIGLPVDQFSVEFRWESPSKAMIILALTKPKLQFDYSLEGALKNDLVKALLAASRPIVDSILSALPLNNQVLGQVEVPAAYVDYANVFKDALPTRAYLAMVKCKRGKTKEDAVAVRVICGGNHLSGADDPEFKGTEHMVLRISEPLIMNGVVLPVLLFVSENLQAHLRKDLIAKPKETFTVQTVDFKPYEKADQKFGSMIDVDRPDQLAKRPLFKNYKELCKALEKLNDISYMFRIGFTANMKGDRAFLSLILSVVNSTLGDRYITGVPKVGCQIGFQKRTDGNYVAATLESVDLWAFYKDDANFIIKIGEALFGPMVGLLWSSLALSIIDWILVTFTDLDPDELIEPYVHRKLTELPALLELLETVVQYAHNNPTKTKEIIDRLNAIKFIEPPLTPDSLVYRFKLPAALNVADMSRFDADTAFNIFGQLAASPPAPRPTPSPLKGLVNIYEHRQTSGECCYSTSDAPPFVSSFGSKFLTSTPVFSAFTQSYGGYQPVYIHAIGNKSRAVSNGITRYVNSFQATAAELLKECKLSSGESIIGDPMLSFFVPAATQVSAAPGYLYHRSPPFGGTVISDHEIKTADLKPLQQKFFLFPVIKPKR